MTNEQLEQLLITAHKERTQITQILERMTNSLNVLAADYILRTTGRKVDPVSGKALDGGTDASLYSTEDIDGVDIKHLDW